MPHHANDAELIAHTHPTDWVTPTAAPNYDLVVIGGGTAGLVSAGGAGGLGARVALIEREYLGGDCLVTGCVPSKALIRCARVAAEVRHAREFGVAASEPQVDFAAVMQRMRRLRSGLSHNDGAARFEREYGVDVFFGDAKFVDARTVEVAGQRLRFGKAVIATGARPRMPDIPGLADVGACTSETVFELTHLPQRWLFIGGGPIGCELAQTFARFGAVVTILLRDDRILPHDEPEAASRMRAHLEADGVKFVTNAQVERVERINESKRVILNGGRSFDADELMVAVGRQPNVAALQLEAAGVGYDADTGVEVDDHLRTSNRRIFAAGDCCSRQQFTHAAEAMARIVIRNALFWGSGRVSKLRIPHVTYTDPEVASIGMTEAQAREHGVDHRVWFQELATVDRAVLDGSTTGFVKVITAGKSDRILGATIMADHAGEWLTTITLAMTANVGLKGLAELIYPYPTQIEAIKKLADNFNRARLTPFVKRLFQLWLRWIP